MIVFATFVLNIVQVIIFFWLLNISSEEIWRYSTREGDGTLFTTRHTIFVEHLEAGEEVEWCYPMECSLKNKSFISAILHCPKPGFHPIGPITRNSDNQSVRHINVVLSPFYYEWYLGYNRQQQNGSQEEFKLWIIDPKHTSEFEKNRTVLFPSQYSKELTRVFFQLGQRPSVKLKMGHRFIDWDELQIDRQSFNATHGYWKFSVNSAIDHQMSFELDGQSVALHDRFIRKSFVQLLITKFDFPAGSIPNQAEEVLKGGKGSEQPFIVQDPCAPHVAVLIR
ncbi:cation channel sperm-associated auxiliary subunit epsilon-like [Pocillopora verrucosa]|uniref:cation channel sperm-associated auxiliary subunit epsilon-like n=1 Tax=Pocillopora verrucosa TaxID=203993 RepID=UPI00333ED3AC